MLRVVWARLLLGILACWCHFHMPSVRPWRRGAVWRSCIILVSMCPWVIGPIAVIVTSIGRSVSRHGFPTILAWVKCVIFRRVVSLRPVVVLKMASHWYSYCTHFPRAFCTREIYALTESSGAGAFKVV